jgi:hypothetical protein
VPGVPANLLDGALEHYETFAEVEACVLRHILDILILACTSDKVVELRRILDTYLIDSLYIVNIGEIVNWSNEPWWNQTTIVHNSKQLMRHLCIKTMLCCYREGLEHQENDDNGLANSCLSAALRALETTHNFM